VASLSIDPDSTVLSVGSELQLGASMRDSEGRELSGRPVTWSTANPAAARVSKTGVLTGVAAGATTISATSEGVSDTATVVVLGPVATIAVYPDSVYVVPGDSIQLELSMADSAGHPLKGRPVQWVSSDTDIAVVRPTGLVVGVGVGAVEITASSEGRSATAILGVSVNDAQFITQNMPSSMQPGEKRTVTVRMKNTGSATWTRAGGYKLGTQNPRDNTLWTGTTRVYLSASDRVEPGQAKSFTFQVTAPNQPGTYNFQWQMVQEGVEWFGQFSANVRVEIASTSTANDASFVGQSVPATIPPGATRTVSVTMKNDGSTTWTQAGGYKLGTQNPRDNTLWTGGTRVRLSQSDAIKPGQSKTFTFDITAPNTPGTYDFQWRMVHEGVEWFGDFSQNLKIKVETPQLENASQFAGQTVPQELRPGQKATVTVAMKNTGGTTWTRAGGYKLGTQSPQDNTLWTGQTRVYLSQSEAIKNGQTKSFSFEITAPGEPGTYDFQWRMVQEGVEWFGAFSEKVRIVVTSAPAADNDAQFVAQGVPSAMKVGERRDVTVTMRNTGSTTWTRADGYKLGTQNPQDNKLWTGSTRVWLSAADQIEPGAEKTFSFTITAPATPGIYDFQWQMVQEGVKWFGQLTENRSITVTGSGPGNGNCPAANPNDVLPDDAALQACLNGGGTVKLEPGSPGYIIAQGIRITVNGTVLTSAAAPTKARLIADPELLAPLIDSRNRWDFTIEYVIVDGNKNARTRLAECTTDFVRTFGSNINIGGGHDIVLRHIESVRTMCGTAIQISATDYEIAHSRIADNGFSRDQLSTSISAPWSDGITALKCSNSHIHHNTVVDNTDIGIISGGGPGCVIENNTITQTNVRAFGGLAVHNFPNNGAGDHSGAVYRNNTITSGYSRLDFGMTIGMHPWFPELDTRYGSVLNNTVSGAVVNLAVDGYSFGTIEGNDLSNPQGSFSHNVNCPNFTANYTVAHVNQVSLQPGWESRSFDAGSRCSVALTVLDGAWEKDVFDELIRGPLQGQNGWTSARATSPQVVDRAGTGGVLRIQPPAGGTEVMGKDVPDQSANRQRIEFDVMVLDATEPSLAKLEVATVPSGGWDKKFQVYFGSSMRVNYNRTGAAANLVPATQNGHWYHVVLELDLDTGTLDAWVDGERVVAGIAMHPGPITELGLSGWDRGPGAVFLDNLLGAGEY
jgi:hypothetical protein